MNDVSLRKVETHLLMFSKKPDDTCSEPSESATFSSMSNMIVPGVFLAQCTALSVGRTLR